MNIYLLMLILPTLLVVAITKIISKDRLTGRELLVQSFVPLIAIIVVWSVSQYSMLADTEIWNGKVTGKDQVWTYCSHNYECHCKTVRSGSGKNRTSRQVCETCHEHPNDWNWTVSTSVGDFDVDRIDSQGRREPPRWSAVYINQPAASEHSYTNYIRGAPDSLFHFTQEKIYKGKIPDYPSLYDYQFVDHVLDVGAKVPNLSVWKNAVASSLNDLGNRKQVNIIVVFTNAKPIFANALRSNWFGGKKNDVIVVIGTQYPAIRWIKVFSWAQHDIVNVALRSELLSSKTLDPVATTAIISRNVDTYYQRKPMKDFEYLSEEASPPLWVMMLALVLGLGSSIFLGYHFHHNDPFDTPRRRRV